MPIVDAVPVVRCARCRHGEAFKTFPGGIFCPYIKDTVPPDGYCYMGEETPMTKCCATCPGTRISGRVLQRGLAELCRFHGAGSAVQGVGEEGRRKVKQFAIMDGDMFFQMLKPNERYAKSVSGIQTDLHTYSEYAGFWARGKVVRRKDCDKLSCRSGGASAMGRRLLSCLCAYL